jgi:hypothetical protein
MDIVKFSEFSRSLTPEQIMGNFSSFGAKMDISLHVPIGINARGPIIAGVLGNENRVFDVIDDARLQSKSLLDTIQMSVEMQEFVAKRRLALRRRDNVALKGKEGVVSTDLLTDEESVWIPGRCVYLWWSEYPIQYDQTETECFIFQICLFHGNRPFQMAKRFEFRIDYFHMFSGFVGEQNVF